MTNYEVAHHELRDSSIFWQCRRRTVSTVKPLDAGAERPRKIPMLDKRARNLKAVDIDKLKIGGREQ